MPFPRSGPILVLATVDSERYTKVDIADTLDNGAIIRKRILNKVCQRILDDPQELTYQLKARHMEPERARRLTYLRNRVWSIGHRRTSDRPTTIDNILRTG